MSAASGGCSGWSRRHRKSSGRGQRIDTVIVVVGRCVRIGARRGRFGRQRGILVNVRGCCCDGGRGWLRGFGVRCGGGGCVTAAAAAAVASVGSADDLERWLLGVLLFGRRRLDGDADLSGFLGQDLRFAFGAVGGSRRQRLMERLLLGIC